MAQRHIPSLDGLRAASIALVLVSHASVTTGAPHWLAAIGRNQHMDLGRFGVRVFFVISGFLITGLLMQEEAAFGGVSLPRFYLRRTLRIFPPYFALVAVIILASWLGHVVFTTADLVHVLTYTINYHPNTPWVTGHLWSLGMEEQFYLLWPAALVLAGQKHAWRVALAAVVLIPAVRLVEAVAFGVPGETLAWRFETAADPLAMGCLLALWRDALYRRTWYRRLLESRWQIAAIFVAGMALRVNHWTGLTVSQTIVTVSIALAIDACVRYPTSRVGKLLNSHPIAYVGTISYSLYLWQQPLLDPTTATWVTRWPVNLVMAAIVALASYYLIEQPARHVRPRVEAWLTHRRALVRVLAPE